MDLGKSLYMGFRKFTADKIKYRINKGWRKSISGDVCNNVWAASYISLFVSTWNIEEFLVEETRAQTGIAEQWMWI